MLTNVFRGHSRSEAMLQRCSKTGFAYGFDRRMLMQKRMLYVAAVLSWPESQSMRTSSVQESASLIGEIMMNVARTRVVVLASMLLALSVTWLHAQTAVTGAITGYVSDSSGNAVAGATVDATEDWWGCPNGPGSRGCSSASGSGIVFNPWLTKPISNNPQED